MKKVRRSDTAPEVKLRKALHRLGLRYLVGDKRLPGTPDVVFPKHRVALFVHGCFWHGHNCRQGRVPSTNEAFWVPKIKANRERDQRKRERLEDLGWRVLTIWECEFKKLNGSAMESFASDVASAIVSTPFALRHF